MVLFVLISVIQYILMKARDAMFVFYRATMFSLALLAAFPNRKPLSSQLKTFLLYKVWPLWFKVMWFPLVPMVFFKVLQFINNKNWDEFLDIMHMFVIGCFTLYLEFSVQINTKYYAETVKIFKTQFRSCHTLVFKNFLIVYTMWAIVILCFIFFIAGCLYYNENLVPVWIPFIDNDKPLPTHIFLFVWVYEGLAGFYMFIFFMIVNPFIIVSTICICNEISYLIKRYTSFMDSKCKISILTDFKTNHNSINMFSFDDRFSLSEMGSQSAIRKFVKHHLAIRR